MKIRATKKSRSDFTSGDVYCIIIHQDGSYSTRNDFGKLTSINLEDFEIVQEIIYLGKTTSNLNYHCCYELIRETDDYFWIKNRNGIETPIAKDLASKIMQKEIMPCIELGNIIEVGAGHRGLIVGDRCRNLYISWFNKLNDSSFNSGVQKLSTFGRDGINKIFAGINDDISMSLPSNIYSTEQKLIWQRPTIKEVTFREVAEKFGVPVQDLRIKD